MFVIMRKIGHTWLHFKLSEDIFAIKKVKNIVLWTYVIEYLYDEEIIRTFHEKELQKTKQTELKRQ